MSTLLPSLALSFLRELETTSVGLSEMPHALHCTTFPSIWWHWVLCLASRKGWLSVGEVSLFFSSLSWFLYTLAMLPEAVQCVHVWSMFMSKGKIPWLADIIWSIYLMYSSFALFFTLLSVLCNNLRKRPNVFIQMRKWPWSVPLPCSSMASQNASSVPRMPVFPWHFFAS